MTRMQHSIGTLAVALALYVAGSVSADTARLSSGERGTIEITGTVVDYTGEKITIERPGGQERSFPAGRVIYIDTDWPPGYETGQAALAERDYRRAVQQLTSAARGDQRPWVRRLAMTGLMQCYAAAGDWTTAGDLLVAIAASDPTTQALDTAPLAWFPIAGVPRDKVEAWLASDMPVARLLGASHALQTSRRDQALAVLRELQQTDDPRVATLATAQRWRAETVTATPEDVARWEAQLRQAPEAVQAGGWLVIGDALTRLGEHDRAVLAYLRVPVLYAQQRQLAARALLEAARVLLRSGERDEAARIARELAADYADLPPAKEVQNLLQSTADGRRR